jgi:O-6-methylguanine DNA methyltransferase
MTMHTPDWASTDLDEAMAAAAIAGLRVGAPATLLPRTLLAIGLADAYATLGSPVGPVFVAWNVRGVSMLALAGEADAFEREFVREMHRPIHRVASPPPRLARSVVRRLSGDRSAPVAVDLRGRSPFEEAVLRKALEIPAGEVRPYGWIAAEIGRPNAVRAVGTALGHNPIPLLIPCHRVVRSDGHIGEYSMGGPDVKRRILSAEGLDLDRLQMLARHGIRFIGSDTTRIFCMPTCRHALRILPTHQVEFSSLSDTARAGYRPCRTCRPAAAAA